MFERIFGRSGTGTKLPRPKNVVLIYFDDLNDWIGPLGGYPGVHTPNLDWLAGRGVTFQRAYCAVPVCNASRCSLLLSRYPHETGIYGNGEWIWDHATSESLVEAFRRNGFRTVGRGKIYHKGAGSEGREQAGKDTSLSVWDDYEMYSDLGGLETGGQTQRGPYAFSEEASKPGRFSSFDWGAASDDLNDYRDPNHVDSAITALSDNQSENLFLAVGFEETHIPWYAPQRFFDLYPLEGIRLPGEQEVNVDGLPEKAASRVRGKEEDHRIIAGHGLWKEAVQAYLATISFVDHEIGRLLEAVEEHLGLEETVVVAVGDHGWHLGEKLAWRKSTLWEEATRVPLMMAGCGIRKGADCQRVVSLVDVFPTLSELCRLQVRDRLSGESFAPLLEDPHRKWPRTALTTLKRKDHAVCTERYRYIRYRDRSEELYDLSNDPSETHNLATDRAHARIKRDLAKRIPREAR